MRILCFPDSQESGAAENAPVVTEQVPAKPAPAAPKAPEPAPTITLSKDEYHRLQGMERTLNEFQAERDRKIELAEQARIKAIADKEGVEKGLAEERTRWEAKLTEANSAKAQLEQQYFGEKRTAVISDAMAGYTFRSAEAERDARNKLEAEFETVRDGSGILTIRDKQTGRPAADVVKERLASDSFAHFLEAKNKGGAGGGGTTRPATKTNEEQAPADLGNALLFRLRNAVASEGASTYVAPRNGLR